MTVAARTGQMESDVLSAARRSATAAERALSGLKLDGIGASAKREFSGLSAAATDASERAGISLGSLAAKASAVFAGFSAGRAIIKGVSQAANFEQLQIAFTGLLGSAERADAFLKRLQQVAAVTPFQFAGLAQATQQLIALGKSGDEAVDILLTISDAASAAGASQESISRIVLAISQIQAKGRLAAEELNQIAEALPTLGRGKVFEELAKSMHLTTVEVQKLADTGGIAAKQGIAALLRAMKDLPGAAGASVRQSQTLTGVISTLKDNLANAATKGFMPLAKSISETLKPRLDALGGTLERTIIPLGAALTEAFKVAVDTFTALTPLIPPLASAFGDLLSAVVPLVKALLPLAGPVLVAAVAAFGALASILNTLTRVIPTGAFQALLAVLVVGRVAAFVTAIEGLSGVMVAAGLAAGGLRTALASVTESLGFFLTPVGAALLALGVFAAIVLHTGKTATEAAGDLGVFADMVGKTGSAADEAARKGIADYIAKHKDLASATQNSIVTAKDLADAILAGGDTAAAFSRHLLDLFNSGKLTEPQLNALSDAAFVLTQTYGNATTQSQALEAASKSLGVSTTAAAAAAAAADASMKTLSDNLHAAVDAQEAMDAANKAVTSSTRAVAAARKTLADLEKKGAVDEAAVAQAQKTVEQATRSVADATYSRIQAEKALQDLLKPATARELGDAQDEAAGAQIALERATKRNTDAQALLEKLTGRAAKTSTLSKRKQDELTAAQLDARQAALDQKNAQEALDDANKGLQDTQGKGIIVTDAIVAAGRALEEAKQRELDSIAAEDDARQKLAVAQAGDLDYSNKLQSAKDALADAQSRASDAAKDAKLKQEALNDALDLAAGKTENAQAKLAAYAKEMRDLGGFQGELRRQLDLTWQTLAGAPELKEVFKLTTVSKILDFLARPEIASRSDISELTFALLGLQEGGIFSTPTPAIVGHGKEVVIPLEKPRRAMDLAVESGLLDVLGVSAKGGTTRVVNLNQQITVPPGVDPVTAANIFNANVLAAVR